MTTPIISFENVTIQENDTTILHDVSFTVNEGERAVVYGPSGSGKSTILNTLLGVYTPAKGEILINSQKLVPETITSFRHSLSYIAQDIILGAETVREAILLPFGFKANKHKKPQNDDIIIESLKKVHMSDSILDQSTATLSGGERQRIAIVRELLMGKSIFILDEVTTGLDSASRDAVIDAFKSISCTILSSSHDDAWLKICNKSIVIESGKVTKINSSKIKKGTT